MFLHRRRHPRPRLAAWSLMPRDVMVDPVVFSANGAALISPLKNYIYQYYPSAHAVMDLESSMDHSSVFEMGDVCRLPTMKTVLWDLVL